MGKMCERRGGIIEKAQCDPAGHEVEFGPVVLIRRGCGVADDLIGSFAVSEIEQLAGKHAPLAPPLVGILPRHCIPGRCEHQSGGFRNPIIAQQPMNAAERISQVPAYLAWNLLEQRASITRFRHSRLTRVDDRDIGTAQPHRCTQCRHEILGPNATVHPLGTIGQRHEIGKGGKHLSLNLGRQLLGSPSLADLALRAAAVTLVEQHASKRQAASRAGRLADQEATHRHGVAPLLPQRSFRAPAQQAQARPARMGLDECCIPVKIGPAVLGA